MGVFVYLLLLIAFMHIVENFSPIGEDGCSNNNQWPASELGGTCWRYCAGDTGAWCYTADNCRDRYGNDNCFDQTSCSGKKCPFDEPNCVEECTCNDPPSESDESVKCVTACEGMYFHLRCRGKERRKKINVTKAVYGRTDPGSVVCPHAQIYNTSCTSDSTEKVTDTCSGVHTCGLSASNSFYGDPCFGTHKYLKVWFTCV